MEEIAWFLIDTGRVVDGGKSPSLPLRDESDRHVPAEAIAGGATILVTGDADLLAVASEAPLEIVSPRGFWEKIRDERGATT